MMRASRLLSTNRQLNLVFPIPGRRMFSARAKVLHQVGDLIGLEFCNPAPSTRAALNDFIESRLATS